MSTQPEATSSTGQELFRDAKVVVTTEGVSAPGGNFSLDSIQEVWLVQSTSGMLIAFLGVLVFATVFLCDNLLRLANPHAVHDGVHDGLFSFFLFIEVCGLLVVLGGIIKGRARTLIKLSIQGRLKLLASSRDRQWASVVAKWIGHASGSRIPVRGI